MTDLDKYILKLNNLHFTKINDSYDKYLKYKLLIIYDKISTNNSEKEVNENYKTYEIKSYKCESNEFWGLEGCWSNYFGVDNPTFIYFFNNKIINIY